MNAMSARFVRELHQILDVLQYPMAAANEQMTLIRVLILRGEGPSFCAGYDFKDASNNRANQPFLQHALSGVIKKLRETLGSELSGPSFCRTVTVYMIGFTKVMIPQPVVCGVNGPAVGGGMSLALAGDLRVGSKQKARFLPTFVKLGLGGHQGPHSRPMGGEAYGRHKRGELGTSYFLPRLVGRGRAAAALLTGKEISTEQAEQWGLLNEVVEESELAACCRKHAKERVLGQELSLSAALDREDLAQSYMVADAESQEVGRAHIQRFQGTSKL
eukprot:Skav200410  [mRNA]  locus=scaffold236:283763:288433:- [translate_table: standard]